MTDKPGGVEPGGVGSRRRPMIAFATTMLALALLLAGSILWYRDRRPDSAATIEPVAVTATGPRFDSVDQLVEASSLVLLGEVTDIGPGRALSDPSDPTAGIRTQLVSFRIDVLVKGSDPSAAGEQVVIEQEAELLDGTPLIVNGLSPLSLGDRGVVFLVEGDGEEYPYTALVNEQGWIRLDDGVVDGRASDDALWRGLARTPQDRLVEMITS